MTYYPIAKVQTKMGKTTRERKKMIWEKKRKNYELHELREN